MLLKLVLCPLVASQWHYWPSTAPTFLLTATLHLVPLDFTARRTWNWEVTDPQIDVLAKHWLICLLCSALHWSDGASQDLTITLGDLGIRRQVSIPNQTLWETHMPGDTISLTFSSHDTAPSSRLFVMSDALKLVLVHPSEPPSRWS
jgi:hypothetical protein